APASGGFARNAKTPRCYQVGGQAAARGRWVYRCPSRSVTHRTELFFSTTSEGCRSGLENRRHTLSTCGADGDQAADGLAGLLLLLVQHLGQRGHDPGAGRGERVAGRQRRAVDVELAAVDRAERGIEPQLALAVLLRLERLECGEH